MPEEGTRTGQDISLGPFLNFQEAAKSEPSSTGVIDT